MEKAVGNMSDVESILAGNGQVKHAERLGKIRGYMEQIDTSEDLNVEKLKHVFDLIDESLIEEYESGLRGLDRVWLERNNLNGLNTRRSEMEILAFILHIAREGVNKTKILYQANLSFSQMKNYLRFLITAGFLEEESKKKKGSLFRTTNKGNLFIYHWLKMLRLLETDTVFT